MLLPRCTFCYMYAHCSSSSLRLVRIVCGVAAAVAVTETEEIRKIEFSNDIPALAWVRTLHGQKSDTIPFNNNKSNEWHSRNCLPKLLYRLFIELLSIASTSARAFAAKIRIDFCTKNECRSFSFPLWSDELTSSRHTNASKCQTKRFIRSALSCLSFGHGLLCASARFTKMAKKTKYSNIELKTESDQLKHIASQLSFESPDYTSLAKNKCSVDTHTEWERERERVVWPISSYLSDSIQFEMFARFFWPSIQIRPNVFVLPFAVRCEADEQRNKFLCETNKQKNITESAMCRETIFIFGGSGRKQTNNKIK